MIEEDNNRKRKNPFDFISDDDFEKIFNEMQKYFENGSFKEMLEDMFKNGIDPNKQFIQGFKVNIGPDGKPNIQKFGNKPTITPTGQAKISKQQEPLTDIIECNDTISVTIEIPGVKKEDIKLNVGIDTLEISVNTNQKNYHKIVNLPAPVKEKTTKATYNNGILDVIIDKKNKQKKDKNRFPVDIQ
jgi:HSP20 family protein